MKNLTISALLFLFIFVSSNFTGNREPAVNLSGSEILDKCIKHYDPDGLWDSYQGKVHLNTIFPNWTSEEVLEINNATGFYQSTRLSGEEKIIKGTKDGKCIRMIGGRSELTEKEIEDNGLDCDNIGMSKEHHICHFGFVMNMRKAGLTISDDVTEEEFNGWDCYVLSHSRAADEVIHDYYRGEGKLYIDKRNYVLRGREVEHPDYPKRKIIYNSQTKVGSIVMPEVAIYYAGENKQFAFVDIFRTME